MKKAKVRPKQTIVRESTRPKPVEYDFSALERIPVTYGELVNLFAKLGNVDPSGLRKYTLQKIEQCTGTPVICYVTKTQNLRRGVSASIDDFDLLGFNDLLANVRPDARALDVVIISNGGSAEATERIVDLLRGRFSLIRFLVPHNAYSAATLMCFSGNEIIMGASGTLGPIDPQIDGIPARAILRGFAEVEKRLKEEGPETLTAYMPLISQYSLHLFEICKSAQELS